MYYRGDDEYFCYPYKWKNSKPTLIRDLVTPVDGSYSVDRQIAKTIFGYTAGSMSTIQIFSTVKPLPRKSWRERFFYEKAEKYLESQAEDNVTMHRSQK